MNNEENKPATDQAEHSSYPTRFSAPMKQSKLGVTSFVLSMSMLVILLVLLGTLTSMIFTTSGESELEIMISESTVILVTIVLIAVVAGYLIGLILGLTALFQKGYKKSFAVMGTIFNLFGLAFFVLILLSGFIM